MSADISSNQAGGTQVVQTMRPLRIGQFTDSYPPIINGVAAFVSDHHQELLAQYQNSFVFTFGYTSDREPQPGVYRTAGVPLGNSPFRVGLVLDQRSTRIVKTLDILHVHEPFGIANVATQFARKYEKPLIYTNHTRHDIYTNNYPRMMRPPLRSVITATVEKLIRMSAISSAPTEDTARWMRSLVPDIEDRVIVRHNAIHLSQFDRIASPLTRDELGIPADQTIFLWVGRLTPEKNLDTFAAAFMNAIQRGAQAHWIIVGAGRMREPLEIMLAPVRERVHFMGAVPRSQVPHYIPIADVFGTASLSETNCISVIEAMACNKPYVGLQADWWNEFGDTSLAGVLTDHSVEALGGAIKALCEDPARRRRLGDNAKRISVQFDMRTVTAQWIETYHAALEPARR